MIVRTDFSSVYTIFFFVLIEQINNMENGFIDVIIQAREQTIYKHCVAMKNYNNENANEDYSGRRRRRIAASTKSGKINESKKRGM